MDGKKYREILKRKMAPYLQSIKGKTGCQLIFQHDNDPKHRSKVVSNYLFNKRLMVLDWPSQSPDINPIENAWRQVKVAISNRPRKASSLDETYEWAQEEWKAFPFLFSEIN